MQQLRGKVALVTGGSRGLGLAVGTRFAQLGADVLLCARDSTTLCEARAQVEQARSFEDQRLWALTADVSQERHMLNMAGFVEQQCGQLDILVCCAGMYGPIGLLTDNDLAEWQRTIEVNLFGTVMCCKAFLPLLRRQQAGKIVVLSGGGATAPMPHFSAYGASKAAVVRFAETLAAEVRGSGIDVNAVAPGMLHTRMLDQVLQAGPSAAGGPAYDAACRLWAGATPAECQRVLDRAVDLIVFLSSCASDGITGRLLSAAWDNWQALARTGGRSLQLDDYTLRRQRPFQAS